MTATLDHTDKAVDWASVLRGTSSPTGFVPTVRPAFDGADDLAASLLAAARDAAVRKPELVAGATGKAMAPAVIPDPAVIDKNWLDSVLHVVETVAPVVINALTKDFSPESKSFEQVMAEVPAHRRDDKDWIDFTATLIHTLLPAVQAAMQGQKAYDPSTLPELTVPAHADKNWLSDAFDVVKKVAPVALSIAGMIL